MKKSLIIFMPSIEGGGVEKNFFIISNYLSDIFKDTTIITSTNKFNYKLSGTNIINPSFKFKKTQGRKLRYLFCLLELIKLIFKNKKKVIVLTFQANLYSAIICKILGIKIIIRSNSSPTGWSNNIFKKFFYKIFLTLPDKIIVNSNDFKKELKSKFKVDSLCIFNPLNINEIKKKSKERIKFKFFSNNKDIIKIIFVGRYVDQKDPMTFLNALSIINNKLNFKALIVGRGILRNKMNIFIKKNKLEKKVKLLNFQDNPYKYIARSDLLVLTSKFEGLPNVLLEALSLNKFIISSNCPTGPREILDCGKGGFLFEVGNFQKLAKKIILFNDNKRKYNKKLIFARGRLTRFSYKNNLNKYFKLIKNEL
jgi:glycosyltransferase involved in cell wall biosynthesis